MDVRVGPKSTLMEITKMTHAWKVLLVWLWIMSASLHKSFGQLTKAMMCTSPSTISNRFFIQDIPEDWAVGTVLAHLDIIGDNSQIQIRETSTDPHIRFDSASRNLTLVQQLDREEGTGSIKLDLTCTISDTKQNISIPVEILILDINDNPPVFDQHEYSTDISELTPVGSTIFRNIIAQDDDVENWYITYEILPSAFAPYFSIPIPSRGEVVLAQPLDYESIQTMSVQLMALDNQLPVLGRVQPRLNDTATLIVNILDGDDRNPAFINEPYMVSIVEDTGPGSLVPVIPPIAAFDQDVGINASIYYSLVKDTLNDEDSFFNIDPIVGSLTLAKGGLIRGTKLCLLIKATQVDNEDRFATTSLRIWVTPANENPPKFQQPVYVVEAVENLPIGTLVATIRAKDNDENPPPAALSKSLLSTEVQGTALMYRFRDGQVISDFVIGQETGQIVTAQYLDYETIQQYNLAVEVTDGLYVDEGLVTVNVININDNKPVFSTEVYHFEAQREKNGTVGTVTAYDADPGSRLTYRLVGNVTSFRVNDAGQIVIMANPDDLTDAEYRLFVLANDHGSPPLEGFAVVVVSFGGAVGAVSARSEADAIVIIVLGILAGILLIIIIIMFVYIYRKRFRGKWSNPSVALVSYVSSKCVQCETNRQSFESRLNFQKPANHNYFDDPEGLAYKPKSRHLALYNEVQIDESRTRTQENPFVPDESYDFDPDVNENEKHYNNSTTSSLSGIHSGKRDSGAAMNGVKEIEYDTAVAPMDQFHDILRDEYMYGNGSIPSSSTQSISGSLSTFKGGGSTQKLVTPRGTPKGSLSKRPAVSFIDDHQVNIYNPQNAIDPHVSVMPVEDERPGITVYY